MNTIQDYKIFLDDERMPAQDGFVIVRDFCELKDILNSRGIPKFMTFDHDLGDLKHNGKHCAELVIAMIEHFELPPDEVKKFKFDVHSQNPVGRDNIKKFLDPWLDELSRHDR
jgi:hypothetical protein